MLFKDIVGQKPQIAKLLDMVKEGRVPHALMFTGAEGCGNLPAALAFVQYLFCSNKQADDACGTCASCLKVSKLIHPDLHFVFPIPISKQVRTSNDVLTDFRALFLNTPYFTIKEWFEELGAENKQPLIPADEANSILKTLSYTSYEGGYKIMIIWQPERMNTTSANKLLKILEEPPEQTLFLLVSNHPEQLLTTIQSRVQLLPFYGIDSEDISQALTNEFGCQVEEAKQVALLSDGNYREAQLMLQNIDGATAYLQNFRNFMLVALKFNGTPAVTTVEELAGLGREKQKYFLQYALEIFRDCLMLNYGNADLVRHSGAEKEFITKFSKFVHQKNYERLCTEFNTSFYHIERNANPKILFMDLLLKTNELINIPA